MENEHYPEAETLQRESLAIRRKHLPAGHPHIGSAISPLCWTLSQRGKLDEAEGLQREVLDTRRKLYGPDHPEVVSALSVLSEVLRLKWEFTEAEARIREAIALDLRQSEDSHFLTVDLQQTLGMILSQSGRFDEAESLLRDTLRIRRKLQGNDHIAVADQLSVGGFELYPEENRLSRMEALRLYTVGSAWFSSESGRKGSIAPGQLADLAVLSQDYFSIPEERIKRLPSVLTVLGGKVVYADAEFSVLAPPPLPVTPDWSPVKQFGGYGAPDWRVTSPPRPHIRSAAAVLLIVHTRSAASVPRMRSRRPAS